MKMIHFVVAFVLAVGAVGGASIGCGIAEAHTSTPNTFYTFVDGEVLDAAKLNANFQHLHNTFTGGITNSMINSNAGISHNKLASPTLVPKAVGGLGALSPSPIYCTVNGPCTSLLSGTTNVSGIERVGAGAYIVTLITPMAAGLFVIVASTFQAPDVTIVCSPVNANSGVASQVRINCINSSGTSMDANFTFVAFGA